MTQLQSYEDLRAVKEVAGKMLSPLNVIGVERVLEGISTAVFRIETSNSQFYSRVELEQEESFESQVHVHQILMAKGIHVPEVVAFENHNELLGRSVMLTKAIPGKAIGYDDQAPSTHQILREAGRDLAFVHQVQVEGFGWINHGSEGKGLTAEHTSLSSWLENHFFEPLHALIDFDQFPDSEANKIMGLLDVAKSRYEHQESVLAHGDFDVTHIFYDSSGYTGLIDFGDIRGAYANYDLGHFSMENGHLLHHLLKGYSEVTPLNIEAQYDIQLTAILVAARRIGRRIMQQHNPYRWDWAFIKRAINEI